MNSAANTSTINTDKLRLAVAAEKLAAEASLARYKVLSAKITAFQMGDGHAPTEDEFNQWLADVHRAVELKRLLSGISC